MQFSNKFYDTLKWISLICLPALNTFLGVILPAVGVADKTTSMIITIIAALSAFIGTLIGISTASYNKEK